MLLTLLHHYLLIWKIINYLKINLLFINLIYFLIKYYNIVNNEWISFDKWPKDKVAGFVNSVPKGTLVFSYGEEVLKNGNGVNKNSETDAANEFFIKNQLGLTEEEQAFEDTQGYLEGIGKKDDKSITNKRIKEIKEINIKIVKFILSNLHNLYWRDYTNGVISTMDPNKAVDLLIPPAALFREALVEGVNKKYNQGLSVANVKNLKESHDVDIKQRLGDNVPKIKKSKK